MTNGRGGSGEDRCQDEEEETGERGRERITESLEQA